MESYLTPYGVDIESIQGLTRMILLLQYQSETHHATTLAKIAVLQKEIRDLKADKGAAVARRAHPILAKLPISLAAVLQEFKSLDEASHNSVVSRLALLGGRDLKDAVYKVCDSLIAPKFSLDLVATDKGAARHNKLSFQVLEPIVI